MKKIFLVIGAIVFVAQAQATLFLARPYDPNLARWITRDPIGERGGNNLYVYVNNNPVNEVDPLGLSPADVSRLTTLSYQLTDALTQNGQRMNHGDINNILSDLQHLTRSKNPYLGCGEQADALSKFLNGTGTDDQWEFYRVDGYDGIIPHQWLVAVSSNPNDPQLYLDPWKNQFNTSGDQMHGHNMFDSTFGTVPTIRGSHGMTLSP